MKGLDHSSYLTRYLMIPITIVIVMGFSAIAAADSKLIPSSHQTKRFVGLIIDDMGYRHKTGKRALALPANITYSFLPYTPYARELANQANAMHKEVMLHMPMEADNGKKLGPGGLTSAMTAEIFDLELQHCITSIPNIKGINNHMGSLLTRQLQPMRWLMKSLAHRSLYFVDSRTTVKSVALRAAREQGITSETRDIFIDHDIRIPAIKRQLEKLISRVKRKGSVLAIAHPFPETMSMLEKWIPKAKQQGIEFVYISKLMTLRKQMRAQNKREQERLSKWQASSSPSLRAVKN